MKPIAVIVGVALLLLYVWERNEIVRAGYHIERLKEKKVALQRERNELRVKVSALTAPERIARAASDKLEMMPPRPGQVVLVRVSPEVPAEAGAKAKVKDRPAGPELRLAKYDVTGREP
jgi:cell division protein FtsL